jgi:hypothetical protein
MPPRADLFSVSCPKCPGGRHTPFCRSTLTFRPGSSCRLCGRSRSTAGERAELLTGGGPESVVGLKVSMTRPVG